MGTKLWGLKLLLNIASLYFSIYVLSEWIFRLEKIWLILPTWMIFAFIILILNACLWLGSSRDGEK